ncbi:FG-GAP repeat protein [Streptomyces sp. M19]
MTGHGARRVEEPASAPKASREDGRTIGNRFGEAVRLGDTNGDGAAELAVGAPITNTYVGALWVFPAKDGGWPEDAARPYHPDDFEGPPVREENEMGTYVR